MQKTIEVLKQVFKEIPSTLEGDEKNQFLNYRYITWGQLKRHLNSLFKKHDLLFIPEITEVDITSNENKFLVTCTITLKFYYGEDDIIFYTKGQAEDSQGKGLAKAVTDGLKRFFINAFLIDVEEEEMDEDRTYGAEQQNPVQSNPATDRQKNALKKILQENLENVLTREGMSWDNLTTTQASFLIKKYGNG